MANAEYRFRLHPDREALWQRAAAEAGYTSIPAWLKEVGDLFAAAPFDPLEVRFEIYLLRQETNRMAEALEAVHRLETPPAEDLPAAEDVDRLRARLNAVLRS